MDFGSLKSSSDSKPPTDPIRIFEASPSLSDTFNDLWRGQADALTKWNKARTESDVLVSLNTGAGKTVVGTLIAQSLVNEGLQNVLYVCSTIDLVKQTSKEANKLGLRHSCRVKRDFDNDLFETGRGFCITTYQAIFNGHSAIRNKFFPEAIIFDDAHVADTLLRDAFTLTVDGYRKPALFNEIFELFRGDFDELGISGRFRRSADPAEFATCMVPPGSLSQKSKRLDEILRRHNVPSDDSLTFPYAWLEDHYQAYCAIFSHGRFELTPIFLPSRALDIFSSAVQRRVYLSATLESQTDFIRAFGRKPKVVITPENDAGNGERLIIDGRKVVAGITPEFVRAVSGSTKVVIAVPSYHSAERWATVATPPAPEEFSERLEAFRGRQTGAFVLVSRVDGIDLPHQTCRIMVMEGLPGGTTLLERYQWEFLRMSSVHSVRVANRLAQLFGRINRGRNDYGAFLIEGSDLSKWLNNDRNLARLPPLLQKQILVGRTVQEGLGVTTQQKVIEVMHQVLSRDQGWLDYYQSEVKLAELDKDQLERHFANEPALIKAAQAEAKYAEAMWQGDVARARRAIEETIDETTEHDTTLGGWHALWLGATFDIDGDAGAALPFYGQAMSRLGGGMTLPRPKVSISSTDVEFNSFGQALYRTLNWTHHAQFQSKFAKSREALGWIDHGSPKQAEEGVRVLGELLGFVSSRPDNDGDTGPDVLWAADDGTVQHGFELKTDKGTQATYFKDDINQALGHLEWMKQNFPNRQVTGLSFVGPSGQAHNQATPSSEISLILTEAMAVLRDRLLALVDDLRMLTPMERAIKIGEQSERPEWAFANVVAALAPTPLSH
jgi:hypothetical protein